MRLKPKRTTPARGAAQQAPDPGKGDASAGGETKAGSGSRKPQWVTVEHRDSDGHPTFPKTLIAGTYHRKFGDVPQGSKLKIHVLAGYKPKPVMMIERKIYEIHRLSLRGWRRSGQIAVEMDSWRHHEADWFKAMRGVRLRISDPGLPGPHNEESDYLVSKTSFDRKVVSLLDDEAGKTDIQLHEGTLDITET